MARILNILGMIFSSLVALILVYGAVRQNAFGTGWTGAFMFLGVIMLIFDIVVIAKK